MRGSRRECRIGVVLALPQAVLGGRVRRDEDVLEGVLGRVAVAGRRGVQLGCCWKERRNKAQRRTYWIQTKKKQKIGKKLTLALHPSFSPCLEPHTALQRYRS